MGRSLDSGVCWFNFFDAVQKEADNYSQNFRRILGLKSGSRFSLRDHVGVETGYQLDMTFNGAGSGNSPERFEYILNVSRFNRNKGTDELLWTESLCSTEFALRMYYGALSKLVRGEDE